jgi:hypothetical protein
VTDTALTSEERAELEALRTRVAALEAELTDVQARTNAVIAAQQERLFWLDRWHLDLNALMQRRGAAEVRWLLRAARWPVRQIRLAKRRLLRR